MTYFQAGVAGALATLLLTTAPSHAAPVNLVGQAVLAPLAPVIEARVRVRRHVRRQNGPGPAAVLGIFGAVVGAAFANNRYENYSYQSYGYANDYYAPGYGYGYAPHYGSGYRGRGWRY